MFLGLTVDNINTDVLKRGVVFVHGRALDNTRIGATLYSEILRMQINMPVNVLVKISFQCSSETKCFLNYFC